MGAYAGTKEFKFSIEAVEVIVSEKPATSSIINLLGDNSKLRIFDKDRYGTSVNAAEALKKSTGVTKFQNIIVANGRNYADALAGTYLAKVKNAPIIVVGADEKSQLNIFNYIKENLEVGGTVYILGGTGAVSQGFQDKVEQASYTVKRLWGKDRFKTNIEILKEAGVSTEDILICSGYSFADSLSASSVGLPILLVGSNVTEEQFEYLKTLNTSKYYLIGGSSVVSQFVEDTVKELNNAQRIYGANRYATSTALAKEFFKDGAASIVLAYGLNFPDGLSAGPLAMSINSPLILATTDSIAEAQQYAKDAGVSKAIYLGGTSLISEDAISKILGE
jgi:putative cell wall-binding protein